MAQYDVRVIEFRPGITLETFEKDADFQTWTKTDELGGKTRIVGKDPNSHKWVETYKLDKVDNRTYVYNPSKSPETDKE